MTERKKGIGELNGKWEMLFKICLVVLPIFITATGGLLVWLVKESMENSNFRLTNARLTFASRESVDSAVRSFDLRINSVEKDLTVIDRDFKDLKSMVKEIHRELMLGDKDGGSEL